MIASPSGDNGKLQPGAPILTNEERLLLALEAGGMGLWEFDPRSRMLHGSSSAPTRDNHAMQASFHLDRFLAMIEPEFREGVAAALEQAIAGATTVGMEYRITRPDGETRWIEAHAYPVLDRAGSVERLIAMTRDITDVRQAEAAREALLADMARARKDAERSIRQRDSFISSTVHDLRTPLTYIRGRAQILQRRILRSAIAPDDQQWLYDGFGQIINGIQQMTDLLADLQDVIFLQAGRPLELRLARADLVEFVQRIAIEFRQQFPTHRVTVEGESGPMVTEIDTVRMRRVVSNLLMNAIKYSDMGTTVDIRLSRRDGWDEVRIRDEGIGIPENELNAIFERFRRGSNATARHEGSGIGLAGARAVARQHGGDVTVESTLGVGSTFTVRLPHRHETDPLADGLPTGGQS